MLLAVPLVLSGVGCGELGEPAVVTIGSRPLYARDLREIYSGMDASQRSSLASREERVRFVDQVVERALLEDHGRELVAAGEIDVEAEMRRTRENMLERRLRTILGSDTPLDSARVREAYDRMGIRYRVRVASFPDSEQARQVLVSLAPGQGLESLPDRSGRASLDSWVVWSPLPDPVADAIVDHPPGDVVGPVLSRNWWCLLEAVESRPVAQDDYETLRPRILRGLRVRGEAESTRALLDRLLVEARMELRMPMIERLSESTREAILRTGATESSLRWAIPTLSDEERERPVVEWRGGRLTGADYLDLLEGLSRSQRPRSGRFELAIGSLVQEAVGRQLLLAEAERRGLDDDWWVRRAVNADRTDRLIRRAVLDLKEGRERRAADDSLLAMLRASQPQMFRSEARARTLRFDLPTRELAEQEITRIRAAGGGLERLRERLEADVPSPGTYHLLEVTRAACPDSGMARDLFEGATGEPVGPYDTFVGWIVAVCLGIETPRDITDEEVRATGSTLRADVVQEWIRLRRVQLGVTVNQDALDALGPGG